MQQEKENEQQCTVPHARQVIKQNMMVRSGGRMKNQKKKTN